MFYKLHEELEEKGNFGERDRIPKGYDVFAENAQGNLSKYKFLDREIIFSDLILSDDSSEVDFIKDYGAIGGYGLIVSARIKELLSRFNLGKHRFYPLGYIDKNNIRHEGRYYWLQILVDEVYDWIDYKKSVFYWVDFIELLNSKNPEKHYIMFNNARELEEYLNDFDVAMKKFRYEKIVMTDEYCKNPVDLFHLQKIDFDHIITKKLKEALEKIKATGIEPMTRKNIFCQ